MRLLAPSRARLHAASVRLANLSKAQAPAVRETSDPFAIWQQMTAGVDLWEGNGPSATPHTLTDAQSDGPRSADPDRTFTDLPQMGFSHAPAQTEAERSTNISHTTRANVQNHAAVPARKRAHAPDSQPAPPRPAAQNDVAAQRTLTPLQSSDGGETSLGRSALPPQIDHTMVARLGGNGAEPTQPSRPSKTLWNSASVRHVPATVPEVPFARPPVERPSSRFETFAKSTPPVSAADQNRLTQDAFKGKDDRLAHNRASRRPEQVPDHPAIAHGTRDSLPVPSQQLQSAPFPDLDHRHPQPPAAGLPRRTGNNLWNA